MTTLYVPQGVRVGSRKAYFQVVADFNRLAAQIANLGRIRVQSAERMSLQTTPGLSVLGTLEEETRDHGTIHFESQQEMAISSIDLAVSSSSRL